MKKLIPTLFFSLFCFAAQAQDIFSAARTNNTEEIENYIIQKIAINQADERGNTPLTLACYYDNYDAALLLLQNGANPNAQDTSGNSALMGAIFKGHTAIIKLLIEQKADINQTNFNGATALIFAATFGKSDVTKSLLEAGANKNITDNRGKTALDYAVIQENKEVISLLQ